MALQADLMAALQAVAPVTNLYIGDPANRATWQVGFADTATAAQKAAAAQIVASFVEPQTVFDPETLITTLFTPAEQVGFMAKPQGSLFATLIAASGPIDITSAGFKGYIAQAVAGGFLTQDRANQVLAGTPAPQTAAATSSATAAPAQTSSAS